MSDDIRQPPAAWYTHPEPNPLDIPNQAVMWHDGARVWVPVSIRYLTETPIDEIMREWFPYKSYSRMDIPNQPGDRSLWGDVYGEDDMWHKPAELERSVTDAQIHPLGDPMAIADYVMWGGPEPEWPQPQFESKPVGFDKPQIVSPETVSPDD